MMMMIMMMMIINVELQDLPTILQKSYRNLGLFET